MTDTPVPAPRDRARPTAHWHALAPGEALELLQGSASGLTDSEAGHRLEVFGRNCLPPTRRRAAWRRLLAQFNNLLIHLLLAAASITLMLGHWLDAVVITTVVILNACIGFVQEGKAEAALASVQQLLSRTALVERAGRLHEIDAEQLVPGDIVHLASGDRVPADLRLLDIRDLAADEAALTGESMPVDKAVDPLPEQTELAERRNMCWSGTLVTRGRARGLVVATGHDTQIGHISDLLGDVTPLDTPLLRQLATFGRQISVVVVLLCLLTFLFGTLVRDYPALDMFMAVVSLAVAAIPEELPAILTITLAFGVQRMARRQAIIRRLPTVEALGALTVICTDKTGTLTRNEMTVQQVILADGVLDVEGDGYNPSGRFLQDGRAIHPKELAALQSIARAVLLCNDALLEQDDGDWHISGDPTEGSLVVMALKAGLDRAALTAAEPRCDALPFESEHRYRATLHPQRIVVLGAPEKILELCTGARHQEGDRPLQMAWWQQQMEDAARQGHRLLAVAEKAAPAGQENLEPAHIEAGGFTLLGLCAQADPPRSEAIAAIARVQSAGMRVKMITGDHALTAQAIGHQLGLGHNGLALTGRDLDAMDEAALRAAALDCDIFARTSPEHKLRLVQALQSTHEVVAMTGDGVNDAPALKQADVGVAMGRKGTETSREAAGVVLADDNFASIAAAVEEGRTVHDNLRKVLAFVLPTNGGEVGMLLLAVALGMTLPFTASQILWINMVTTVTLAIALVFEPPEANVMQRPPRQVNEPLLSRFVVWRMLMVTLLMVAGGTSLFHYELAQDRSLEWARTVAVNALVIGEMVYLFNCRFFTASTLSRAGLLGNPWVPAMVATLLLMQLLFTYLPALQTLFGSTGLDAAAWARLLLFGIALYLVVELEKAAWRWRHARLRQPAP